MKHASGENVLAALLRAETAILDRTADISVIARPAAPEPQQGFGVVHRIIKSASRRLSEPMCEVLTREQNAVD